MKQRLELTSQFSRNAVVIEELKMMLRIAANLVAHGQTHLFPLLQRLERDYDVVKKDDPVAHAKKLLADLSR